MIKLLSTLPRAANSEDYSPKKRAFLKKLNIYPWRARRKTIAYCFCRSDVPRSEAARECKKTIEYRFSSSVTESQREASRARRVYRGNAMRHISGREKPDSASDSAYRLRYIARRGDATTRLFFTMRSVLILSRAANSEGHSPKKRAFLKNLISTRGTAG